MQHFPVLDWFAFNWLGNSMRTVGWLYPLGQILHFVGLCFLAGAILLVDVRLLGFLRRVPVGAVLHAIPIAIAGFALNAITGVAFFASDPYRFWFDTAFRWKLLAIGLAGLNAIWFTFKEQRQVLLNPMAGNFGYATKVSAALSLFLWTAVIVFGRLLPVYQP
jgi:hypothetical protein